MPAAESSAGRSAVVRAAGGVVCQVRTGRLRVAVVHRPRYDDWSLPKGKLGHGEPELVAAVREVREETGSVVAVTRRLTPTRYAVVGGRKTVSYWVMRHLDGAFTADAEVDRMEWLAVDEARTRVSYDADRSVLNDFVSRPVPDSVVVLVRHARAGKRANWKGDDLLRPLESAGRAQARRLSRFLNVFDVDRVVTARPERCRQTVQPFADEHALDVTVEPAFDDSQFARSPRASVAALLALAKPRHVTVVCSQGEAIPGLITRLAPEVRSTETRKGAAWVLSFADGELVSADYYGSASR